MIHAVRPQVIDKGRARLEDQVLQDVPIGARTTLLQLGLQGMRVMIGGHLLRYTASLHLLLLALKLLLSAQIVGLVEDAVDFVHVVDDLPDGMLGFQRVVRVQACLGHDRLLPYYGLLAHALHLPRIHRFRLQALQHDVIRFFKLLPAILNFK